MLQNPMCRCSPRSEHGHQAGLSQEFSPSIASVVDAYSLAQSGRHAGLISALGELREPPMRAFSRTLLQPHTVIAAISRTCSARVRPHGLHGTAASLAVRGRDALRFALFEVGGDSARVLI